MSKVLVSNYSFDASEKKITFTDINPIILERVLIITNSTDNIIIYNFSDPTLTATCATNILTLAYNTTTMSDSDKLQIYYDDASYALPVSATIDTTGLATSAKQLADGHTVALSAIDNAVLDAIDTILDTINAKLVTGTDIGDVTINNTSGASAVNIQDGGNSITVDGTVAITGGLTDTELRATAVPVSVSSIPSHNVTNTGTFATQATLAAETTKVIGTVNIASSQSVSVTQATASTLNCTEASASAIKTAVEALDNAVDGNYLNVNLNLAGTDCPSGNGTAAGSQRVTIASDSTGQMVALGNIAHDSGDSGNPLKIGGRASTSPVTAVAANDRVDAFFDVQGRQAVAQKASTANLSNVAGSASNVTLLASNTARLGATIYNDSTAILYVKFGATASTTSFTVKMVADSYYEVPFGYYGIIDGVWASATGSARITEVA